MVRCHAKIGPEHIYRCSRKVKNKQGEKKRRYCWQHQKKVKPRRRRSNRGHGQVGGMELQFKRQSVLASKPQRSYRVVGNIEYDVKRNDKLNLRFLERHLASSLHFGENTPSCNQSGQPVELQVIARGALGIGYLFECRQLNNQRFFMKLIDPVEIVAADRNKNLPWDQSRYYNEHLHYLQWGLRNPHPNIVKYYGMVDLTGSVPSLQALQQVDPLTGAWGKMYFTQGLLYSMEIQTMAGTLPPEAMPQFPSNLFALFMEAVDGEMPGMAADIDVFMAAMTDLLSALHHLHRHKHVYTDLKWDNVGVKRVPNRKAPVFKLIDLGSIINKDTPNYLITTTYRSPEAEHAINQGNHEQAYQYIKNPAYDIWQMGRLMAFFSGTADTYNWDWVRRAAVTNDPQLTKQLDMSLAMLGAKGPLKQLLVRQIAAMLGPVNKRPSAKQLLDELKQAKRSSKSKGLAVGTSYY